MTDYTITLPRPRSVLLGFLQDGLPGMATINAALQEIDHKIVFRWQLSVLVEAENLALYELPGLREQAEILDVQTQLASRIEEDGQAVWLARVVYNGAWELLWRVHDVRQVQARLEELIKSGAHLRPFSYKLDDDPLWAQAQDYLQQAVAEARLQDLTPPSHTGA